jgi:hypothetical protein
MATTRIVWTGTSVDRSGNLIFNYRLAEVAD